MQSSFWKIHIFWPNEGVLKRVVILSERASNRQSHNRFESWISNLHKQFSICVGLQECLLLLMMLLVEWWFYLNLLHTCSNCWLKYLCNTWFLSCPSHAYQIRFYRWKIPLTILTWTCFILDMFRSICVSYIHMKI